jgi:uncharacterized metal-binding protein
VYSCSGASSAAQLANHLAIRLDRLGVAEMSCIAGVGGDVGPLVRTAKSGRPILVLDGCPLRCAAHILERHGIQPDWQFDLSQHGVAKRKHEDFDPDDAARVLRLLLAGLRRRLPHPASPSPSPRSVDPASNSTEDGLSRRRIAVGDSDAPVRAGD